MKKRKTKHPVFAFLTIFSLIMIFFNAGAVEQDMISLGDGVTCGFIAVAAFGLFGWLGGYIEIKPSPAQLRRLIRYKRYRRKAERPLPPRKQITVYPDGGSKVEKI